MCCTRLAENTGRNDAKRSPSGHHPTTLSGYIFATKAYIDNRKKLVKQQYLPHMSLQYGELWPTSGWDRFVSLEHPSKFQRLSRLDSVTARHSSSGRQPKFAALKRGRHLHSAGRPSRWALAHILVNNMFILFTIYLFIITCRLQSNQRRAAWNLQKWWAGLYKYQSGRSRFCALRFRHGCVIGF